MKNSNKAKLTVAILIFIGGIATLFKDRYPENNLSLIYNETLGVYTVNNEEDLKIVDDNYQDDISKLLWNLKNDELYTHDNPLLVLNPYGTNVTGLYIYFLTFQKAKIEYTISIQNSNIPDYTNTLSGGLKRIHEGQIIGLLQGYTNDITLKVYNKNNIIIDSYNFSVNIPDYSTNSELRLNSEYSDISKISDGLYIMCSSRGKGKNSSLPLSFYDANGILRAEFTKDSGTNTFRIEFIDGNMLYGYDEKTYVLVNPLGKIEKTLVAKKISDHDTIYSRENNSLYYITESEKIREISLKNNHDRELLDLGDLLAEYKQKSEKYYQKKYNYFKDVDWAHINSIEIINKKDLILSVRNTHSIIYVQNIYDNPSIKYIIAPDGIYDNTAYSDYLLQKVGDFQTHAGQHAVIIEKDNKLKSGQYYLYFYNNNYAIRYYTFNEHWVNSVPNAGKWPSSEVNSSYFKYLIDEKERTYELVESIDVPYSPTISNVQKLDTGYLINSGDALTVQEYDNEKKVILTLSSDKIESFYRFYKHDMKNFWFDDKYSYIDKKGENNSFYEETESDSIFYYNDKTNAITGVNSKTESFKESDLYYFDTIYFTIYDYEKETLTIPSKINGTKITKVLGQNIGNVKKIIIEEGIEEIANYAFLGAKNVEEIVLPKSLNVIGNYAFTNCRKLKKIVIPKGVEKIGDDAFYGWKNDQTIIIKGNTNKYGKLWKNNSNAVVKEG